MHRVNMEQWICREEGLTNLTRENLEELQLMKLNRLLKRLRQKGGIYENLPDFLHCLSELAELPFTTSQMLQASPSQFLNCSQSQVQRVISQSTSGTSGGAKRVFYSGQDLRHTVDFFASGISEMLAPGEKCLIAFPFSGPSGLGDLIARAVEKLHAIPVKAGFGQSFREALDLIAAEKPEAYIGFSAPLLSLKRMYSGGFPIKKALLSGDSCPEGVLKSLNMPCFPHYGSRETALGGAVTCQAFHGMHLRENHIIAEIIDPQGRPVADGTFGELIITTIGMEAMPLLRYRTGDRTRILAEPCPCGGVTHRLDRVVRMEHSSFSMEALDNAVFSIPQVVDFRASLGRKLYLDISVGSEDVKHAIREAVKAVYPHQELCISCRAASPEDHPAYSGKRHILKADD